MGRLIFEQDPVPGFKTQFMMAFAKHLWQMKQDFHLARRPLEQKWRECDEAYLCFRELPHSGSIDWIDDGDLGESDAFDNVNVLSYRMAQALMPRRKPWLRPASKKGESVELVEALRDFLIFKHRQARSRRSIAMWLKMMIVRGDGGFMYFHEEVERLRRLGPGDSAARVADEMQRLGMDPSAALEIRRARESEIIYSGPTIRVLDTHDYFNDPHASLSYRGKTPIIIQTFRLPSELKAETDEYGKPVYSNLDSVEPSEAVELFSKTDGMERIRSLEIMGMSPEASNNHTKLVPVYVFYIPYIKFTHGNVTREFHETYFHVALNRGGKGMTGPRIIRVEENPSDHGHVQILTDTYHDFFTHGAPGIGAVEKTLADLRMKNLLKAITSNAAVAAQFPAWMVKIDAFKSGEISALPGAINEVDALGELLEQIAKPLPTPDRGLQLGLQDLRFWGDEIRTKMGIDGLAAEAGSRSTVSEAKTATEVNRDQGTSGLMLDEFTEKYSDPLTEFVQGSFDMMRQRIGPDQQGLLEYQKALGEQIMELDLPYDTFARDRSITVVGVEGVFAKEQRVGVIIQAMDMTSRLAQYLPNAPVLVQALYVEAMKLLDVPLPEQAMMTPQEIAAQDPNVRMMAIQEAIGEIGQAAQMGQLGGQVIDVTPTEI